MVRTPLAMLLRGQIALSFKDYWRRCTYLRLATVRMAHGGAAAATRGARRGGGGRFLLFVTTVVTTVTTTISIMA